MDRERRFIEQRNDPPSLDSVKIDVTNYVFIDDRIFDHPILLSLTFDLFFIREVKSDSLRSKIFRQQFLINMGFTPVSGF